MSREADVNLLSEYGIGALKEGQPELGYLLMLFAGRIALSDKHPEMFKEESNGQT